MFACSSYNRVVTKEDRKNQVGTGAVLWLTPLCDDPGGGEGWGSIARLRKEERDCKTTSFD